MMCLSGNQSSVVSPDEDSAATAPGAGLHGPINAWGPSTGSAEGSSSSSGGGTGAVPPQPSPQQTEYPPGTQGDGESPRLAEAPAVLHPHYDTTAELVQAYETATERALVAASAPATAKAPASTNTSTKQSSATPSQTTAGTTAAPSSPSILPSTSLTSASTARKIDQRVYARQAQELRGVMLRVIEQFNRSLKTQANMDDVVPLAACKDREVVRQLVQVTLAHLNAQVLCEPTVMNGLTHMLMLASKDVFVSDDLRTMLDLIVKTLSNLEEDQNVTAYLGAVSLLLDTMYDGDMELSISTDGDGKTVRDRIRDLLGPLKDNSNPEIAFLARYTAEVLQRVPNQEEGSMGTVRKVLLIMEIVGSVASIVASHGTDLSGILTVVNNCSQLFSTSVISDLAVQAVGAISETSFQGMMDYVTQTYATVSSALSETQASITEGTQTLQDTFDYLQRVLGNKKRKGWYIAARTATDTIRMFVNLDRAAGWKTKFAALTDSILNEAKSYWEFTMAVTRSAMLAYDVSPPTNQARPSIIKLFGTLISSLESKQIKCDKPLLTLTLLLQYLARIAQGTNEEDAKAAKSILLAFETRVQPSSNGSSGGNSGAGSSGNSSSSSSSSSSASRLSKKERKKFAAALQQVLGQALPDAGPDEVCVKLLQPNLMAAANADSATTQQQSLDGAASLLGLARKMLPLQYRIDTVLFEDFWRKRTQLEADFTTFVPPQGNVYERQQLLALRAALGGTDVGGARAGGVASKSPAGTTPHAQLDTADTAASMLVHELARAFLALPQSRVLLIQGVAGAGKSLILKYLRKMLWEEYTYGRAIPLLVPLSSLENPASNAIQQVLTAHGCSPEEIVGLRQNARFVFLLDGYDEIKTETNLFVTNKLGEWNAKVIITCRSEYLANRNYQRLFQSEDPDVPLSMSATQYSGPSHSDSGSSIAPAPSAAQSYSSLFEITMRPFDDAEIEQYLHKIVAKEGRAIGWDFAAYQRAMRTIPGLLDLVKTPFMLTMVARILPTLATAHARKKTNSAADRRSVRSTMAGRNQSQSAAAAAATAAAPSPSPLADVITRTEVYEEFVRHWFRTEEMKIRNGPERSIVPEGFDFEVSFRAFSADFAFALFLADKTSADVRSCNYEPQALADQKSAWDRFFKAKDDDRKVYLASKGTPWRISGSRRSFIHKSLLEYFVSVILCDELLYLSKSSAHTISTDILWNRKLLHTEPSVLLFLVDRLRADPLILDMLLDILDATKVQPALQIAGANIVTVLNYARVMFKDLAFDFRGVNIQGANLSDALMADIDLTGSNLSKAYVAGALLTNAKLDGCDLSNLDFGVQVWQLSAEVTSVVFHPTLAHILLMPDGPEGGIRIVDTTTGDDYGAPLKGYQSRVAALTIDPLGILVAASLSDDTVMIWDLASRTPLGKPLTGHTAYISNLTFNPDGSLLATCSHDGNVMVWSVYTQTLVMKLQCSLSDGRLQDTPDDGKVKKLWNLAFNPRKPHVLFVVGESGYGWVWDVSGAPGRLVAVHNLHEGSPVNGLAVSPDGKVLATTGFKNMIRLWDAETLSLAAQLAHGHENTVRAVCFSHNGQLLASSGVDGSSRLWRVASQETYGPPLRSGNRRPIWGLAFSADDKQLACGSKDKTCRLWTVQALSPPVVGHERRINELEFSPDGSRLVSAANDNRCMVWSISTSPTSSSAKLTPSTGGGGGTRAQYGGNISRTAYDVNVVDGTILRRVPVRSCAFAYDPELAATRNTRMLYGTAQYWHLYDTEIKDDIVGIEIERPVVAAAHSRTSPVAVLVLASATAVDAAGSGAHTTTGECLVWDYSMGRGQDDRSGLSPVHVFHPAPVDAVVFTPNGDYFVTACRDGQVRFWDVNVREIAHLLPEPSTCMATHQQPLQAAAVVRQAKGLAFSSRGDVLAVAYSADSDGEIRFWHSTSVDAGSALTWKLTGVPIASRMYADAESTIKGEIYSMHFSPGDDLLAVGHTDDGSYWISLWNTLDQTRVCHVEWACVPTVVRFAPSELRRAGLGTSSKQAMSPAGVQELLAVGDEQGSIALWEVQPDRTPAAAVSLQAGATEKGTTQTSTSAPRRAPLRLVLRAMPSHAGMELNLIAATVADARLDEDAKPLFADMGITLAEATAASTSDTVIVPSSSEPHATNANPATQPHTGDTAADSGAEQPRANDSGGPAKESAPLPLSANELLLQFSAVLEKVNSKLDALDRLVGRVDAMEQALQQLARTVHSGGGSELY